MATLSSEAARNPLFDYIKAIACVLIVLHHLAFYDLMVDVLQPLLPGVVHWLSANARMAVQVFLVLGGYWAAAALAPQGLAPAPGAQAPLWPRLGKRFVRLCLPYSAALVVAMLVNEALRPLDWPAGVVSAPPTWAGLLAHLLLLHSVGGWESISAGVWYVAIDFQLYALCLIWFGLCARQPAWRPWAPLGVLLGAAASLWVWNLNAGLDMWALYFLGAYGLGMMAWWAVHSASRRQRVFWLLSMLAVGSVALIVAWRDRIALAWAAALLLAVVGNVAWPQALRTWRCAPLAWVGQRSYSIFLIHFPICLLVAALVRSIWPESLLANALGVGAALGLSLTAGALLYACTERPGASWRHLHRWQLGALVTGGLAALLSTV